MPTITLTKQQVDDAFGSATEYHQAIAADKLNRLVYPDWDKIKSIDGWPKCGNEIASYIMQKFIDYDQACHPDVMAGGMWMSNGWSRRDDVSEWAVDTSECEVEYE